MSASFLPSFRDSPLFVSLVRFSARLAPFKRNARTNDVVEASEDFAAKEGRRSERREEDGRREEAGAAPDFSHIREGRVEPPDVILIFLVLQSSRPPQSSVRRTLLRDKPERPHARSLLHRQPPHPSHRSSARPAGAGNPPQQRAGDGAVAPPLDVDGSHETSGRTGRESGRGRGRRRRQRVPLLALHAARRVCLG